MVVSPKLEHTYISYSNFTPRYTHRNACKCAPERMFIAANRRTKGFSIVEWVNCDLFIQTGKWVNMTNAILHNQTQTMHILKFSFM